LARCGEAKGEKGEKEEGRETDVRVLLISESEEKIRDGD
jgi:hypothetical protein